MKRKFEIYQEIGFDRDSGPVKDTIKTFKNEPEAMSFYNNPKNIRRYGTMYLTKIENDQVFTWDDRKGAWMGV